MLIRLFAFTLLYLLSCLLFLLVLAMSVRYLNTDHGLIAFHGAIYAGVFLLGYTCGRSNP